MPADDLPVSDMSKFSAGGENKKIKRISLNEGFKHYCAYAVFLFYKWGLI